MYPHIQPHHLLHWQPKNVLSGLQSPFLHIIFCFTEDAIIGSGIMKRITDFKFVAVVG